MASNKIILSNHSWVEIRHDVVFCDSKTFNLFVEFMRSRVSPTRNPMNPKTNLRRLQCTFGAEYKFGSQKSQCIGGDSDTEWPELVRLCLDHSRKVVGRDVPLAAHANYYPDGAGVGIHHDLDGPFDHDKPILSFTFLSDATRPRNFDIYAQESRNKRKRDGTKTPPPVHSLPLPHGSLLIMGGKMQSEFLHGIASKQMKNHARINLTVRHLKVDSNA
jgi:alkylated DNA repair dioxygenase AlkB